MHYFHGTFNKVQKLALCAGRSFTFCEGGVRPHTSTILPQYLLLPQNLLCVWIEACRHSRS